MEANERLVQNYTEQGQSQIYLTRLNRERSTNIWPGLTLAGTKRLRYRLPGPVSKLTTFERKWLLKLFFGK